MERFDDELREVLRARAERVAVAADPLPGVERRAQELRRRRQAMAAVSSGLAVLAVSVAVPFLADRAQDWRQGSDASAVSGAGLESSGQVEPQGDAEAATGPVVAPLPEVATGAQATRTPAGIRPGRPAEDGTPPNVLTWPARGTAAPRRLVLASLGDFAKSSRVATSAVVSHPLWAGRVGAGGDWLYVFQAWSKGAAEAKLSVYRAAADTTKLQRVSRLAVYFRHAAPSEDVARVRADVGRVALVSVPLDRSHVLVLGAPGVARIGYAPAGRAGFTPVPTTDGVALVRRVQLTSRERVAASPELFQAVDTVGRVMTPADTAATRRLKLEGRLLAGWGIDDATTT